MRHLVAALSILAQGSSSSSSSGGKDLYPKLSELIVGAIAFAVLFAFMWKYALPRANAILEERRKKIQGDLEKAEKSKGEADRMLQEYRQNLAGARDEANQIVEDARRMAEQLRQDMARKAEKEAQAIVSRAQDEIRAERDRVFQELRSQVGELSLQLAGRVVGESLDRDRHLRLIDQYISELGGLPSGNGDRRLAGGSRDQGGEG
jgi:F-type H+-transporting ATPase subunit b